MDNTGPAVSIGPPSVANTAVGPVSFTVTYTDAASISLAPADVTWPQNWFSMLTELGRDHGEAERR